MDIATAKKDLKQRQERVVNRLNEVIALEQQLRAERQGLTEEALKLNGESTMLNRLSDNSNQRGKKHNKK